MLESFEVRAVGKVAQGIRQYAEARVEALLFDLLAEATTSWEREEFSRFSNDEIAFTVRLYHHCDVAIEADEQRWPMVNVQYDGALPTAAMRQGLEDPKRTPRPDLIIYIGRVRICVEAKKLRLDGGFPALYVREGMRRFIAGLYPAGPQPGAMVGYLLEGTPDEVVAAVNAIVSTEPGLGPSNVLVAGRVSGRVLLYESRHVREIRLLHHKIDLRDYV